MAKTEERSHWMCLTKKAIELGLKPNTPQAKKEKIIAEAASQCIDEGKIQRGGSTAKEIADQYKSLSIKKTRKELGV